MKGLMFLALALGLHAEPQLTRPTCNSPSVGWIWQDQWTHKTSICMSSTVKGKRTYTWEWEPVVDFNKVAPTDDSISNELKAGKIIDEVVPTVPSRDWVFTSSPNFTGITGHIYKLAKEEQAELKFDSDLLNILHKYEREMPLSSPVASLAEIGREAFDRLVTTKRKVLDRLKNSNLSFTSDYSYAMDYGVEEVLPETVDSSDGYYIMKNPFIEKEKP